jgi:exopolysaccharide biosynthesis polyprenyl glycosylphosphotransferase
VKRSEILFGILRIPLDALACSAALFLAYRLREANIDLLPSLQLLTVPGNLPPIDYYLRSFVLPATFGYLLVSGALSLYALKITLGPWREISRVLLASILWVALVMAWFFLVQKQLFFSRALLGIATVLLTLFSLTGRTILIILQRRLLKKNIGVRTVLSCGPTPLPSIVIDDLTNDVRYHYEGHVLHPEDVLQKHTSQPIDLVLHTDANPASKATSRLIDACRSRQIGYAFIPPVFADVPHQLKIDTIGLTPMLRFEPTPLDGWGRVIKRLIDVVIGLFLLIILLPILLIISLLVLITSGWPIFYVSKRMGKSGKIMIPILKFRTMCKDADTKKHELEHLSHRQDGPLFKIKNDPRVTPLGRFLRRFSIDELPQLLNVMMGHASLVGPRPHLPSEVERYDERSRRVFTVRPGVTGLAQISGRSSLSFEDEVNLDLRYIEDWSILLDCWILWRTVFVVLFGRGAE